MPSTVSLPFDRQSEMVTVVRSGLVLTGANQSPESRAISDSNSGDALLMADEILTLPLQNTELVVLSACDTGQGKALGGEGLLGIQRAFQVAGARTTVASLWKVDDAATQILMERFHRNLSRPGTTRLDALRDAQLELLRSAPKELRDATRLKTDRLPPYYWAAFTLSGDWR